MDGPKKHLTYGRWCASGSVKSSKGKVYPLSWSVSKICHDLVSKLNLVTHSWPGYYHMTCLKGDLCHTSKSGGGAKTGSLQLLKNYWNSSKWWNFHEKYLNFVKMKKIMEHHWNVDKSWNLNKMENWHGILGKYMLYQTLLNAILFCKPSRITFNQSSFGGQGSCRGVRRTYLCYKVVTLQTQPPHSFNHKDTNISKSTFIIKH